MFNLFPSADVSIGSYAQASRVIWWDRIIKFDWDKQWFVSTNVRGRVYSKGNADEVL